MSILGFYPSVILGVYCGYLWVRLRDEQLKIKIFLVRKGKGQGRRRNKTRAAHGVARNLEMFDIGFFSGDGPVMVLLKCRILKDYLTS